MTSYLRRLLRTGAAYQLADAVSKVVALALLPVYTRHLTRADYGTAELLLTTIILVSIVLRLGLGRGVRALPLPRRRPRAPAAAGAHGDRHAARRSRRVAAALIAVFAEPVSQLLLGTEQPDVIRAAALGLWAFTNLELAYALLRVEERARAFAVASLVNVALTVAAHRLARRRPRRGRARPAARQLRGVRGRADRPVVRRARVAGAGRRASSSARCCASGCRPCPPRCRCSRCSSSTGCGSTASRARTPPASTRSASSSRGS